MRSNSCRQNNCFYVCYLTRIQKGFFFSPDAESTYESWKESLVLFRYPLLQLLGIYRGFVWKYVKHNCLDLLTIPLLHSMWERIFCLAAVPLLNKSKLRLCLCGYKTDGESFTWELSIQSCYELCGNRRLLSFNESSVLNLPLTAQLGSTVGFLCLTKQQVNNKM